MQSNLIARHPQLSLHSASVIAWWLASLPTQRVAQPWRLRMQLLCVCGCEGERHMVTVRKISLVQRTSHTAATSPAVCTWRHCNAKCLVDDTDEKFRISCLSESGARGLVQYTLDLTLTGLTFAEVITSFVRHRLQIRYALYLRWSNTDISLQRDLHLACCASSACIMLSGQAKPTLGCILSHVGAV